MNELGVRIGYASIHPSARREALASIIDTHSNFENADTNLRKIIRVVHLVLSLRTIPAFLTCLSYNPA